jgi:glucose/arabinose dehydrogenase
MRTRTWRGKTWFVAAAVLAAVNTLFTGPFTPRVEALPAGFTDTLIGTFTQPTSVEVLPGGDLLVFEKQGAIRRLAPNGTVSTVGTIDVTGCAGGERGLLGAAIDPAFPTNGVIYAYATRPTGVGCANTLSRFTISGGTLVPGSEQVLIDNIVWAATNHNGGSVEVGRDGFLYLSVGEGAVTSRAQNLGSLGGKILRVTTSGQPAPGNPFLASPGHGPCARIGQSATVCEEVYAYGLRNPFRMAFDPNSATTRFRINDVGANTWEEVNDGIAGANYGWPEREGPCPNGQVPPCSPSGAGLTDPVTSYPSGYIVGGAFVPNGWWGAGYDGAYVFADGGSGDMWSISAQGIVNYGAPLSTGLSVATDFTFGVRNGERAMFYVNNGNGQLRKIVGPNAATSEPAGPAYVGGLTTLPPTTVPPPIPGAFAFNAYPAAQRVLDTRNGIGGPVGRTVGGQPRTVALGVPAGASAAFVNITLDNGTGPEDQCRPPSYLVAWKPGTARPSTSNANVGGCDVAANSTVVQVDAGGAMTIEVYADVHVIVDVLGYYSVANSPVTAGRFQAVTPARLLDSRATTSPGNEYSRADSGNTSVVRFAVAGRAGVPAGARTVSLTVTAIGPGSDAPGYVTAYAGGTAQPPTSTVNHGGSADTRANLALVPVGADGTVELFLYQVANVVVDVGGWITSAADPTGTGGRLRLTEPTRIADSRNGIGVSQLAPAGQVTLEPVGVPVTATAIAQNVTMASRAPGWICATPNPWAGGDVSIQNARAANQDRPATAFTTLGPGPAPRLRYCSQDVADVIVDVFGWFE